MKRASLQNTVLRGADFSCDNLGGATQLVGADLRGADLTDASLAGADLRDAKFDDVTKFPVGFNPRERGMVGE